MELARTAALAQKKGRSIAGGRKKNRLRDDGGFCSGRGVDAGDKKEKDQEVNNGLVLFPETQPAPRSHDTHTRPWPDLNCWGVPWFLALTAGATGSCARRPESAAANGAGMKLFYATVAGAVRRFMQRAGPWSSRCFIKMR